MAAAAATPMGPNKNKLFLYTIVSVKATCPTKMSKLKLNVFLTGLIKLNVINYITFNIIMLNKCITVKIECRFIQNIS